MTGPDCSLLFFSAAILLDVAPISGISLLAWPRMLTGLVLATSSVAGQDELGLPYAIVWVLTFTSRPNHVISGSQTCQKVRRCLLILR